MIFDSGFKSRTRLGVVAALLPLLGACATGTPTASSPKTLEEAADAGTTATLLEHAIKAPPPAITTLAEINTTLRPHDRIYRPEGDGPFPAVIFLHGCSGPTQSHEEDWAKFYNDLGVVLLAVDSIAPRELEWESVCNLQKLTGRERASDALASLEYARSLDYVDPHTLILSGFSHGAWTIWELLGLATRRESPLNLAHWPEAGLAGVRASFLFYGPCLESWNVAIPSVAFLAENDRYIDEETCIDYLARDPSHSDFLSVVVFDEATHTFDHAQPNASNREAGSVYDAESTRAARTEIARRIRMIVGPEISAD